MNRRIGKLFMVVCFAVLMISASGCLLKTPESSVPEPEPEIEYIYDAHEDVVYSTSGKIVFTSPGQNQQAAGFTLRYAQYKPADEGHAESSVTWEFDGDDGDYYIEVRVRGLLNGVEYGLLYELGGYRVYVNDEPIVMTTATEQQLIEPNSGVDRIWIQSGGKVSLKKGDKIKVAHSRNWAEVARLRVATFIDRGPVNI